MKGYKVFGIDWTCRGFQYAVGGTYEMEDEPSCCNRGFHFCGRLIDCFNYYDFDSNNKVAEIEAIGAIDDDGNEENPSWECTGGYLKTIEATDRDKQAWWDNLSDRDKESVMSLPNFDKDIFKEVTRIEV